MPNRMVLSKRRYTFDEWAESPGNTTLAELVDGIPVERVSTSGDHGEVVGDLWDWLRRAQRAGHGRAYAGPTGVLLDPDRARENVREPDLFFFGPGRPTVRGRKGIEGVPDLVIEVLSPGNYQDELPGGSIWQSYERFGVPSYWIVDFEARTVAQHAHRDGRFVEVARLRSGDVLTSPLFPTITLPAADLFRAVDL